MKAGSGKKQLFPRHSVRMDAPHLQPGADVLPAYAARGAFAAGDDGIDDDPVSRRYGRHVGRDGENLSGGFVPDNPGIRGERILSVKDMDIRSADSHRANTDDNVSGLRLPGRLPIHDPEFPGFGHFDGAHDDPSPDMLVCITAL